MIPVPEMKAVDLAFGNTDHLPKYEDVPKEFKNMNSPTKWNECISAWFYGGLDESSEFYAKEGVNPEQAVKAIQAILVSWKPKHEHKMAGCAYLLSQWFDDVKFKPGKRKNEG